MAYDIVPAGTVALPVTVDEAIEQWQQYQELTKRLLDESDYQQIGKRRFKKKSAWRKYARAFNIADEVTLEQIERGEDGFPLWARVRVKATANNGRSAEADHECHVTERCCPAAQGAPCPKRSWRDHVCCQEGCTGRLHWSHPGDIAATALTRAKNRAIADLIGAGEVSAEEMSGQASQAAPDPSAKAKGTSRRPPDARPAGTRPTRQDETADGRPVLRNLGDLYYAARVHLGYGRKEMVLKALGCAESEIGPDLQAAFERLAAHGGDSTYPEPVESAAEVPSEAEEEPEPTPDEPQPGGLDHFLRQAQSLGVKTRREAYRIVGLPLSTETAQAKVETEAYERGVSPDWVWACLADSLADIVKLTKKGRSWDEARADVQPLAQVGRQAEEARQEQAALV